MVGVAQQRSCFGVVQYTAHSSNGKTDRRQLCYHVTKRLGGWLSHEWFDDAVGRWVSEYNVPIGGRSQPQLLASLHTVRGKDKKPVKVEVAAPGRGTVTPMAVGCGPVKPSPSASIKRKTFKANEELLYDMGRKRLIIALLRSMPEYEGFIGPLPRYWPKQLAVDELTAVTHAIGFAETLDDDDPIAIQLRHLAKDFDRPATDEPDYGHDVGPIAVAADTRTTAKLYSEYNAVLANSLPVIVPTTATGLPVDDVRPPTWSEDHGQKN